MNQSINKILTKLNKEERKLVSKVLKRITSGKEFSFEGYSYEYENDTEILRYWETSKPDDKFMFFRLPLDGVIDVVLNKGNLTIGKEKHE